MKNLHSVPHEGQARPILLGPKNCESMAGVSWRWLKDHAPALGLEILRIDSKPFIEAGAALEAIRRHSAEALPANDDAEREDEPTLEDLRGKLGLRRVGSGR